MTETIDKIKAFVMANKKLVAIAGGVLLLLIILIGSAASGGSASYKTAAVNYCKASFNLNSSKLIKCTNKKILKAYLKDDDMSLLEYKLELKESFDEIKEYRRDLEIKASDYKVKKSGVTDYEDLDEDEVEEFNERLRDIGYKGRKVSKLREVTVEYECDDEEYEKTVQLMKIGGKWYSMPY